MRRVLMSRWAVVALLAAAVATMVWSLSVVAARGQARAEAQAQQLAELVAHVVVEPHMDVGAVSSGHLDTQGAAQLQADVEGLRRHGELMTLRVWRLDGTLLFASGAAVPGVGGLAPAEARRAVTGRPWAVRTGGALSEETLRVLVPVRAAADDAAPVVGVAEVALADEETPDAAEDRLVVQQVAVLLVLAGLVAGLLLVRYRLVRRQRKARDDLLTGLLNRRALLEDAGRRVDKATLGSPAALLVIDLDGFRSINDTLGHTAGDLVLQQVASTLAGGVRSGDLLVRLGGDEFAVLLCELPTPAAARERAMQLLHRLRTTQVWVEDVNLTVDASIGIALAPQHDDTVSGLLRRADVAMYQAKRSGSGAALYDPATDVHDVGHLVLLTELRRALDNEELVLHYQPKVALPGGEVAGVEALVRWQHPTRGLLSPAEFMPLAEQSGLMAPLTRWVLRAAVTQAASWYRSGMPVQVAVNISPRNLREADLPARVLATLLAAELPAALLQIEVTETAVMTDPEHAAIVLGQLRARGVEIAIDDFGSGYTSLAHLSTLPVSALKIDQTLITGLDDRAHDHAVTEAMIGLGHRLGLKVIAEGVETEGVLSRLVDLGCDQAQGYLLSRPLPVPAVESWLAGRDVRPGARPGDPGRTPR